MAIKLKKCKICGRFDNLHVSKTNKVMGIYYNNILICCGIIDKNYNELYTIYFIGNKNYFSNVLTFVENQYKQIKLQTIVDLRFNDKIILKELGFNVSKLLEPVSTTIKKGKKLYTIFDAGYYLMEKNYA
jgi:hypothetical protein